MIVLNTGTAGAGKTLFTLHMIEKRRKEENQAFHDTWVKSGSDETKPPIVREVYYFNININKSKLPWIKLDKLEDWYTMPVGSIFLFDECQEAFEPMANSATRPKYYTELSKHRHRGYDMYFVTQHPTFVDTYVRKNAEEHNHFMRPFGAKMVNKHTWKGVKDQCDKSRAGAITERLSHPKEVYTWYKSSEVHTHKFKLPTKVKMMLLLPVLLGLCVYYAYGYFAKKMEPQKPPPAPTSKTGAPLATGASPQAVFDPASFKARFDDIPWSAPRYDELTKPTIAPRIVGCMIFKKACKCLTQQGTYHLASMNFCEVVVQNGIFQDFEDGGSAPAAKQTEPQQAKKQPPNLVPSANSETFTVADSGFNLPLSPAIQKYHQGYSTQQSGDIYYQKLPAGGVMYRGQ
jgi:hypothetical protein